MGIFSRMSDIISSNVNDILDKAEDPAKMIRLIIMEMEETLIEVRASAARAIADQKESDRTLKRLQSASESWEQKAELALSKGREDLARAALAEKRKLAQIEEQVSQERGHLETAIAKHDEDVRKLEAKLREAQARQQTIVSRIEVLENRGKVRKLTASNKVDEAFARFDIIDRRIDQAEARAEAYDLGKTRTLEEEFTELANSDAIDADLESLKSKLEASSDAKKKAKSGASPKAKK